MELRSAPLLDRYELFLTRTMRLFSRTKIAEFPALEFPFVLAVGLIAATISGIVGTGSSIMLMPVLVYQYGHQASAASRP